MAGKRKERVKASQKALAKMEPKAASKAIAKARGTGRTFPTSGQRERSK
jgi:hypothetical protein